MFSSNSGKRSAKHLTKKVPKSAIQATDEINKKLCSRDQTLHKLEKKLPSCHKNEDISAIEGLGKVLQKPQCEVMKTGKPFHKTLSDEVSRYLRCTTKCDTCLKFDYENRNNILSNKKLQNDLRSLACLLKDYIVVNNYSPEKLPDLEKLNLPQISPQEKYEMSKLFELVFMKKSKPVANEETKEELQISQDNLKANEICEEKHGKLSNEMAHLDTLQETDVSNMDYSEENCEKCLNKDEITVTTDEINPSIQVIMPPTLTESGKEINLDDQNALEMSLGEINIISVENEYSRFVNPYIKKKLGNNGMTATSNLKHKTILAPYSSINKGYLQIHNKHLSETKSSYIKASHYGSEKLTHLRSRLLKKLCNSRNIPEILKYKLYLAKLPVRVVLSNIYPYVGKEMQTTKPEIEKNDTVSSVVQKTFVKSLTNIASHNANENKLSQEVNIIKEPCNNLYPMDPSVTEIVIGNTNEEELSNLFGRERKNKFERFCEFIESTQSCINEHKSCSIQHLFEKLCKNKSTLSKIKGNDNKEENHIIRLKKSHSVETSKPLAKPKIKLEVHIPRVPVNCDEPTEETKKPNDLIFRGSGTQICERQDCCMEKTVGVSQTKDGEFKIQEHKNPSVQQHGSITGKTEEVKGKPNVVLSKISKRSKVSGKGRTTATTPRMNKRKTIINENKLYPYITQKDEIKDEKYWKNEFYKKLKCISHKGITENDSLNEILNQVVSVIKFHWGKCLSSG